MMDGLVRMIDEPCWRASVVGTLGPGWSLVVIWDPVDPIFGPKWVWTPQTPSYAWEIGVLGPLFSTENPGFPDVTF